MSACNESQAVVVEKRRFVRYEVDAQVELIVGGRRPAHQTEDLGAGGCRITAGQPVDKGTVAEQAIGFIHAVLGAVAIHT
jgi:hypothetical protein